MTDRDDILARLDGFSDIQRELEDILQTLVLNDSIIIDALAQMLGAIQKMNGKAEQTQARVEHAQNRLAADVRALIASIAEISPPSAKPAPIVASLDAFSAQNPEIALLQYLSAFLDDPVAVDVGAHQGEVAERLLQAGYQVHAFEPFEPTFKTLYDRLGHHPRFEAQLLAIGAEDGKAVLHVARDASGEGKTLPSLYNSLVPHPLESGLQFADTVPVTVRSLASLRRSGALPAQAGLLKIDAEGHDLEIIKGMTAAEEGDRGFAVVMTEFWDGQHAFGRDGHGRLEPIVEAMRERGYLWHIVIYHIDEKGLISHYFNRNETVPHSWGNAIFFRDRALFARAAQWCEAALAPTLHR